MWKIVRRLVGFCIVVAVLLTALAIYLLDPIVPLGKGISDLTVSNQLHYLAVLDQLETSSMLETARRNRGEVSVSSNDKQCEPIPSKDLAERLSKALVGGLRIRTDCATPDFVYVFGDDSTVFAGYVCGQNCGEDNFYTPMMIFGVPTLTR
jgi:hypothetical protein